ncbi:MAG TPA: flavin reductase family protein [Gemmatimonadales bacterium]|nr:flavin reductase family protein [Gemmatimonadales bacterium]
MPDVDPSRFRQLLGRFATGVAIVTTRTADGRDVAMTANSVNSVSLAPPLVAVNVERTAELHGAMSTAPAWAINVLGAAQEELSRRFAAKSPDPFHGIGLRRSAGGLVVFEGIVAHLECERWAEYDGGDHSIFVGRVTGGEPGEGTPLIYFRGGYAALDRG